MSPADAGTAEAGPYFALELARVIEETHDARSLVLEIPPELRATFAYRAGQFLTFHVHVDGHALNRCYSLASSPDTDSEHKVTVKRVEGGRVSNWFHDSLEVGQSLRVMKPAGHFCLQPRDTPIVLFSGGSGITPVISIVKSALATSGRRLLLVYANRDRASVIFQDELERLAAAHPQRFELVHSLDDVDGLLGVPRARGFVAAWSDADFYVCGPAPFMDVVEQALAAEAIPDERIFIERFVSPELAELDSHQGEDRGEGVAIVTLYLDGQTRELPVAEGETILAAAHRAGLDAPCACMEGYCGSCMALVKEGRVEMILNDGGIDAAQEAQGWVLTCQSLPRSPRIRLEYPDPD